MRKARKNTVTRQVIHIVGEGLTELFYFSHLKKILGYRYSISPRLFENNSIEKIEKKIKELLDEDVFVICVFDADVSRRSDAENKKMVSFKKKYENNANVILCDSLQSIEYWFLLHFEDTCRHFQDSAATERALKQYLPTYDKTRKYLEKDKWVKEMLVGSKMDKACELAEKYKGRDSYSEIYKAIKKVSESLHLYVVLGIIISGIAIAFIINTMLTYGNVIKTSLSNDSWLNFWGSYSSGIFAVVVGYLAIIYSNRNSEKAILQQEKLLIRQQNIKKLDDYNNCLKNNLALLNIVDVMGITVGLDHQNISLSKSEICQIKGRIYATDLQYRYVFEVDVQRQKTNLEKTYEECWIKARIGLSDLLDQELSFIERVNQNRYDIQIKENNMHRKNILLELSKQAVDIEKRKLFLQEIKDVNMELERLDKKIISYYDDVDKMTTSIKDFSLELNSTIKALFDISLLLIKEKEAQFKLEK